MPEQQLLQRVIIYGFQPAKRAPVARVLHDDRHVAQVFEGSLRRKQLEFDFRLRTRLHGNSGAGIVYDRLPQRSSISPLRSRMNVL